MSYKQSTYHEDSDADDEYEYVEEEPTYAVSERVASR